MPYHQTSYVVNSQPIKEIVSILLRQCQSKLGPLEPVLRTALFDKNSTINWGAVYNELKKQYPEEKLLDIAWKNQ